MTLSVLPRPLSCALSSCTLCHILTVNSGQTFTPEAALSGLQTPQSGLQTVPACMARIHTHAVNVLYEQRCQSGCTTNRGHRHMLSPGKLRRRVQTSQCDMKTDNARTSNHMRGGKKETYRLISQLSRRAGTLS